MSSADAQVFLWINSLVGRLPLFDRLMSLVANDYLIPASLALALVGIWFIGRSEETRERYQRAVFNAAAGVGITNLNIYILNDIYFRPRPFIDHQVNLLFYPPTDSSFPSNSVAVAFAFATGVWFVNRRLGAALYGLGFLLAFARVYVGVHYPLDIIGGALIGVATTYAVSKIIPLLEPLPTWFLALIRWLHLA